MDDGKTLDYAHKVGTKDNISNFMQKKYSLFRFKYADGNVKMEVVHDGMHMADTEKGVEEQKFIGTIKVIE